jgi:hypothetical protein
MLVTTSRYEGILAEFLEDFPSVSHELAVSALQEGGDLGSRTVIS